MNAKILVWIARIIAILLIIFVSLFALDVFSEGYGFPKIIVALFMHLRISLLLLAALLIAWKRHKIGGAIFLCLGILGMFFIAKRYWIYFPLPCLLIGVLFLISGYLHKNHADNH